MYGNRRQSAAAQRSAERRRREDEAPRLAVAVPDLISLRLAVEERCPTGTTKHLRHVVVANAPALFVVSCGDARCIDGGHDVTAEVMKSLRARRVRFEGDAECQGMSGSASCARTIHYTGSAEYRAAAT